MIEQLFTNLTHAVEGSAAIAMTAAFAWGVLSILLSPCHLVSIVLVVSFIARQKSVSTARSFSISTVFSMGILVSIAAIGVITAAAGRLIGDVGMWGDYFVAGVFFVMGLVFLEVLELPWPGPRNFSVKRKGLLGAFLLGLIFGIAVGPCTFAFMAPVLAVSFSNAASNVLYSAGLLLLYGVGHCSVIVAAGTSTGVVQQYMNWDEKSKATGFVRKLCGIAIIIGGLYMVYLAG